MTQQTASPAVLLDGVSKSYGKQTVVSDVSFNIQPGECVVLVGHNGAGKTTLMKLMLGLTRPTSGKIELLGGNPASGKAAVRHANLGYLPESIALYEAMTGREVLAFFARLKKASAAECETLLETVGLADAAGRRVSTYSKGMRQRLGLAQAMLGSPRLLFLDEPTTGLDPGLRRQFYDLIAGLQEKGATSLISSHALSEVEARANRFVIIKAGCMVASGTLDELYQKAALPLRLQIAVAPGRAPQVAERLGSDTSISDVSNTSLSLVCDNSDKMTLIRRISDLGDVVDDLQIKPPRLDEVYSHYMNQESA